MFRIFYTALMEHPKMRNTNLDQWTVFVQNKLDQSKIYFYPLSIFTNISELEEFIQIKQSKLRISIGEFLNRQVKLETLVDTFFLAVLDIDDYSEDLLEDVKLILEENGIPPTYVLKTDKGMHIVYLSNTFLVKEDNINIFAYFSISEHFARVVRRLLKGVVTVDKVMPAEGFYTRLDGEVIYEGYMYKNFYDFVERFYNEEDLSHDFTKENLNNEFSLTNFVNNKDFVANEYYRIYDYRYVLNFVKFNCPTLNYILNNFEHHTYQEWKLAIWFYYILWKFFTEEQSDKERIYNELLSFCSLYKKLPPEKARSLSEKFFNWFVAKDLPFMFYSCRKMNEVFGCGNCPYKNKSNKLPFLPEFVFPPDFIVLEDKYYALKQTKDELYYSYVSQFFYPISVVMPPWDKNDVKIKIVLFFNRNRYELVATPDIRKGIKEADNLLVNDTKAFRELIKFFNSNLIRLEEKPILGVYPINEKYKYLTIEDFILFSEEDHIFGNLVVEKNGFFEDFEYAIKKLLYDYPDDYFHYKMAVAIALFSIFYLRHHRLFSLNPGFIYFGSPGIGKTTCLKIINSFYRHPNKMYEFSSNESITEAWLNRRANLVRSVFIGDDIKVLDRKEFRFIFTKLYQFANRNLTKLNVQFSGAGNFYWVNIMSSELRFLYNFRITDGLNRRYFFINMGLRHGALQKLASDLSLDILPILDKHYGHGFMFYEKYLSSFEPSLLKALEREDSEKQFFEIFDIGTHNKILRVLYEILKILYRDDPKRAEGIFVNFFKFMINKPYVPVTVEMKKQFMQKAQEYQTIYDQVFDEESIFSLINEMRAMLRYAEPTRDFYDTLQAVCQYNQELLLYFNLLFSALVVDDKLNFVFQFFDNNPFYQCLIENKSFALLIAHTVYVREVMKEKIKALMDIGWYKKFLDYLEKTDRALNLSLKPLIERFVDETFKDHGLEVEAIDEFPF